MMTGMLLFPFLVLLFGKAPSLTHFKIHAGFGIDLEVLDRLTDRSHGLMESDGKVSMILKDRWKNKDLEEIRVLK
jgi:hypothetical protein